MTPPLHFSAVRAIMFGILFSLPIWALIVLAIVRACSP